MTSLSHWAFALLELIALFLLLSPYFLWQRRKGKSWSEIVGGNVEPVKMKRFISASRAALLVGVVLIGLFVAWVHLMHP
jgi:hypothetical protein